MVFSENQLLGKHVGKKVDKKESRMKFWNNTGKKILGTRPIFLLHNQANM